MFRKVRVLGIQITPEIGNKEANLKKIENHMEQNSWFQPDLIVLPEVFNSGVGQGKLLQNMAEPVSGGATTELMANMASKYKTNIIAGSYIEEGTDGKFRNTSIVFNRSGEIIGKYNKIHMFSYYGSNEGEFITPGTCSTVVETDIGKIGLSVCYDLRFPELYRSLTYAGAQIIVCPAAWPYPRLEHWLTLNKARAIENQVYFIAVNQVGKTNGARVNLGHSMIIDPWGDVITSVGDAEGVMMAEIDLDTVKKLREEFPVLNDRNLNAYQV
ncbi:MAG: hypothetical protein ACD_20C00003G0018 [uncultured bacterium]|nr:MAG: hypothetical protein ACD_20C00003G0018 [uncultured bacterium]HBH19079.1 carbon-nitrogen hydrolase [Cyanobacteria bacterium UBA9579]